MVKLRPASQRGSPAHASATCWRSCEHGGCRHGQARPFRELKLWQGQPNCLVVANNVDTLRPNGPAHILGMDEGCYLWQANAALRADDFDLPIVRLPDVDA